jgi:acyl phosphate:glycerol-3-phosphate acyltransferase
VPDAPGGLALIGAAFLAGAIPWGYLVGRLIGGIDLRAIGSGSTGATNVLRTLGPGASAVVLALDVLKGLLPVLAAKSLGFGPLWVGAAAVASVAGHCWSPFIGFRGGKGVATGAGAAVALFPQTLLALPVMAAVVWATRYVSLGSLVGSLIASILALSFAATGWLAWPSAVAIVLIAAIIVVRHAENIQRLRGGSERRVGETVKL